MKESIRNNEDLLDMLDSLLREPTEFWNEFYSDRKKGIPFFVNKPDENLVEYFEKGIMKPGNVLELGSGPGRNAIYFAQKGCKVEAVDLSSESIDWAIERASEREVEVNFIHDNIFNVKIDEGIYDIVYDSGCFHHIAPHRRSNYIELVLKALKPGGHWGIRIYRRKAPHQF